VRGMASRAQVDHDPFVAYPDWGDGPRGRRNRPQRPSETGRTGKADADRGRVYWPDFDWDSVAADDGDDGYEAPRNGEVPRRASYEMPASRHDDAPRHGPRDR